MKKIIIIFITFAIALSSCATQRSTPQRADNLPKVYISLNSLLADNDLCGNCLVVIDGVTIDDLGTKININAIDAVWAVRGILFLVDGQPMSADELKKIDPNDVISVTVLKDRDRSRAFDRRNCFLIIRTR